MMTVNPKRREDKSPKTCSGLPPGVSRLHERKENSRGYENTESRRQEFSIQGAQGGCNFWSRVNETELERQ